MAIVRHVHKAGSELTGEDRAAIQERLAEFRPINGMTMEERKQAMQHEAPVVYSDLDEGYKAMAADTEQEKEADEWINGLIGS
jgi:hypothetical protein